MEKKDRLAWLDVETTGLDPEKCQMIEIGIIITEADLTEVDSMSAFVSLDIEDERVWERAAFQMHMKSGLIDEWLDAQQAGKSFPADLVQMRMANFINTTIGAGVSPACGSTVSFDRTFLKARMPMLEMMFHYRNLDVSSIKESVRRWLPHIYEAREQVKGVAKHRVLDDIRASLDELRFYQAYAFIVGAQLSANARDVVRALEDMAKADEPPTAEDLRKLAARLSGHIAAANPRPRLPEEPPKL